jgi:hypothetical protein
MICVNSPPTYTVPPLRRMALTRPLNPQVPASAAPDRAPAGRTCRSRATTARIETTRLLAIRTVISWTRRSGSPVPSRGRRDGADRGPLT